LGFGGVSQTKTRALQKIKTEQNEQSHQFLLHLALFPWAKCEKVSPYRIFSPWLEQSISGANYERGGAKNISRFRKGGRAMSFQRISFHLLWLIGFIAKAERAPCFNAL